MSAAEREYPLRLPARSATRRKPGAPLRPTKAHATKAVCGVGLLLLSLWRCVVSKSNVLPRGDGWAWVEEFGGGQWVRYPVRPIETVRSVYQSVVYGPGYQGPPPTRSTTGMWTAYPGL